MDGQERRKHERLDLKLKVLCRCIRTEDKKVISGRTLNVSTGGLLAHTHNCFADVGDTVSVQMSIPPAEGTLELGGRIEAFAKIIRIADMSENSSADFPAKLIAMEFCHPPKLSV